MEKLPNIPQMNDLPGILEKSDTLARIDRYLSSLEELASFFISVHRILLVDETHAYRADTPRFRSKPITELAKFEASRLQRKVLYEQRLCQTSMKQFDNLVQMVSRNRGISL